MMGDLAQLRGMTWDHSRGLDPMVATAKLYSEKNIGVEIIWEKRSLQDFADRQIEEMAQSYDLMVIDHPHVGEAAKTGMLVPFETVGRETELELLKRQSVGSSHTSYEIGGQQWGLAIDAATPVATYRPDLLADAPKKWNEVIELARGGNVAFALVPINALMTFFGLAKNLGMRVGEDPAQFIADAEGARVLAELLEIVSLMDSRCLSLDPIGIFEWMGRNKDAPAYSPFGYGYTNYSRDGYCEFPLVFTDAPGLGNNGPRGTVLGGTGIAVSALSKHRDVAVDYAFWIAGAECQSDVFFESGGQPGNAVAWESDECNAACRNFFINTRETLETAWVRPRYDGYMGFQSAAGEIVHACLRGENSVGHTLNVLRVAYLESRK